MKETKIHYNALKDVPASAWEKLSKKRIYFGHQSVGFNIMDGVKDVMAENPQVKLSIIETSDATKIKDGVFAHSRVGQNVDPKSKVDDFRKILDDGVGDKIDIAFMKFCYVDVDAKTDVQKVFDYYKSTMSELQKKFPKTSIVYFSVPLTATKESWKTKLKKLMGKDDIWEYADNIKRNEMNELLKSEYGDSGAFLDIAEIESTLPDGSRAILLNKDGKTYYTLFSGYTYDGGHLNEVGRKKVAEQLLLILVNLN